MNAYVTVPTNLMYTVYINKLGMGRSVECVQSDKV